MTEIVHYDVADQIATITLDSPHNRNALSRQLTTELLAALERADRADDVRVVLLRSADRVFCSGADLAEAATTPMEEGAKVIVGLQRAIVAHSKPVVARLDGPVRAGGIGLIAAADIVIADEGATFALTEVKLGLTPAVISLTVLPRMTSRAAANTFLTGNTFLASEAVEMGLVTAAYPTDMVGAYVAKVCSELVTGAPQGLSETKKLLAREVLADIDARGEELAQLSARLFGSDAAREAMTAFLARKQ